MRVRTRMRTRTRTRLRTRTRAKKNMLIHRIRACHFVLTDSSREKPSLMAAIASASCVDFTATQIECSDDACAINVTLILAECRLLKRRCATPGTPIMPHPSTFINDIRSTVEKPRAQSSAETQEGEKEGPNLKDANEEVARSRVVMQLPFSCGANVLRMKTGISGDMVAGAIAIYR